MVVAHRHRETPNIWCAEKDRVDLAIRADAIIPAINQRNPVAQRTNPVSRFRLSGDEVECSFVRFPHVINAVRRYRRRQARCKDRRKAPREFAVPAREGAQLRRARRIICHESCERPECVQVFAGGTFRGEERRAEADHAVNERRRIA